MDIIDAVSHHLKAGISSVTFSSEGVSGLFVWDTPHGSIQAPFIAGLDGGIQIGVTSIDSIPGCLWVPFCDLPALGFQDGEFLVLHHSFKAWLKPHSPDSDKDGAVSMANSASGSRAPGTSS